MATASFTVNVTNGARVIGKTLTADIKVTASGLNAADWVPYTIYDYDFAVTGYTQSFCPTITSSDLPTCNANRVGEVRFISPCTIVGSQFQPTVATCTAWANSYELYVLLRVSMKTKNGLYTTVLTDYKRRSEPYNTKSSFEITFSNIRIPLSDHSAGKSENIIYTVGIFKSNSWSGSKISEATQTQSITRPQVRVRRDLADDRVQISSTEYAWGDLVTLNPITPLKPGFIHKNWTVGGPYPSENIVSSGTTLSFRPSDFPLSLQASSNISADAQYEGKLYNMSIEYSNVDTALSRYYTPGKIGGANSTTYRPKQSANQTQYFYLSDPQSNNDALTFSGYEIYDGPGAMYDPNTLRIEGLEYGDVTLIPIYQVDLGRKYNINVSAATGSSVTLSSTSYTVSSYLATTVTFTGSITAGYSLNNVTASFGTMSYNISGNSFTGSLVIPAYTLEDITIYTQTSLITYNITYQLNGTTDAPVSGAHGNRTTINVTETFTLVQGTLTRAYHSFEGWYSNAGLTNKITTVSGVTSNTVIYAKWKPLTYNITYNLNGSDAYPVTGTNPNPASYTYGVGVASFSQGTLARLGWTYGGTSISSISTTTAGDKTVIIYWNARTGVDFVDFIKSDPNENWSGFSKINYSVTDTNGKTHTIALPSSNPTRAGWSFSSLTLSRGTNLLGSTPTLSGKNITIPSGSAGSILIKANWTGLVYNYSFTSAGMPTISGTYRTSESKQTITLDIPDRTGYHNPVVSTSLKPADVTVTSAGVITVPARVHGAITGSIARTANNYKIKFNYNGGVTGIAEKSATYDQVIGTLPTTTRVGYDFGGWQLGSTNITASDKNLTTVNNGEVILVAKWTARTLSIVFAGGSTTSSLVNDLVTGSMNRVNLLYTDTINLTNSFNLKGHTFKEWKSSADNRVLTLGSHNIKDIYNWAGNSGTGTVEITLTAQWTANTYSYTYIVPSGVTITSPANVTYGTEITLPNISKGGWTWLGWNETDTAPTGIKGDYIIKDAINKTWYSIWQGITYNIIFDMNGGVNKANITYTTSAISRNINLNSIAGSRLIDSTFAYVLRSYAIKTDSSGANSTISNNFTLNIPVDAYGDITVKAEWNRATRLIYLGSNRLTKLPLGSKMVAKVYLGDNVLFERDFTPEPEPITTLALLFDEEGETNEEI